MAALKQVNEEARQTRLMALDERAKVSPTPFVKFSMSLAHQFFACSGS